MKRGRRTLLGVGLLGLGALVASACGPAGGGALTYATECPVDALDGADGTVDITVWHSYVAQTEEALNRIADRYNAAQDRVHVDIESQGVGYVELQQAYERAIPAGDLPAIAILEDTYTQSLADLGTVLPATQCAEADGYDGFETFLPIVRDYYSVPGTVNGEETEVQLPGAVNLATALLYYNRDHFRDAGLDPDDPPQTLEEIQAAAQALKDAGITRQPFVWNMQPWMVEFWLTGAGGPLVDNNNGRDIEGAQHSAFDNPTTHRLYEFLADMRDQGLINALPGTDAQFDHYFAMGLGQASMTVETSTAVTTINAVLEGTATGEDLGVDFDIPQIDINLDAAEFPGLDEPGVGQMGGGVWYISSTGVEDVEQAAAWDFIKYFNEVPQQRLWHQQGSYLPTSTEVAEDPDVQRFWTEERAGIWLNRAYDLALGLDPDFPGPLIGPYRQVRNIIGDSLDRMMLDGASPDSVIAEADDAINAALERYNEVNF